ncbi:hypothetical protein H6G72_25395 [Planktothricoides sp. FACHB-1370]|uniref:Extensin domain-containing protein n=1 Tax=Planktothricoides raciborskii FACHB-1370 TaxID=2949576 RepID=A0ABR8EKN3_9CYAN|nr:hypothetical protein [Planktothricoides raciborskii FACHB-1370]MBD2585412.1 hypothetical protein [Planktothricoides raciborskii FACHB-1261]
MNHFVIHSYSYKSPPPRVRCDVIHSYSYKSPPPRVRCD